MMPQQFEYPEQGWSTGTMRKVGDTGGPPQMDPQEWQDFTQNQIWGFKADPQSKGKSIGTYASPEQDLKSYLEERPEGFVAAKNHPGLKEHKDSIDTFSIPQSGFEGAVFVKPKPPVMSKMLPTSSQAGQVIEQGVKQSRGKRKEAEAM